MNTIEISRSLVAVASQHLLLERLLLASLEFAVLALVMAGAIWLGRVKSPRLISVLWLLVLAKPVVALLVCSPLCLVQIQTPETIASVKPVAAEPLAPETGAADALPVSDAESSSLLEAGRTNTVPRYSAAIDPSARRSLSLAADAFAKLRANAASLLIALWSSGVLCFAGVAIIDRWRLRRLIASAIAPDHALSECYATIASSLNTRRIPRLIVTDTLESPALAGFISPVIIVPGWLARETSSAKVIWALKHELMHFKQLDPLANLVRELAQALFFFHPAAWWAGKKWEEAAELACDRAIIASQADSHDYAEQLYQMLVMVRDQRQLRLSTGLFATRTQIGRRIAALLSAHFSTPSRLSVLAIAALAALAILTFSVGVGFAERASEEQKEPASAAAADEPEEKIIVAGQVLDPDGKPLSGANLRLEYSRVTQPITQHGPSFTTTSAADGRFRFEVPKSALENSGQSPYWTSARVVATHDGFGFDDLPVPKGDAAQLLKLQLVHDLPIHGRILDIEGRPIAGAKLRIKTVRWTPGESLDTTIDERREGRYTNRQTKVSHGPAVEGDVIATASDGRFTLAGIGAERLVWLQVEGPGIQYSSLEVVTRDLKGPVSAPGLQQRLYGANFEHLAAPSRVISGVVRDQATGKPIVGAAVHGMTHYTAITDESGRYQLLGYAKSPRYDLQIFPRDGEPYFRAIITIQDTAGLSPLEKDIELSSGTIVRGRLSDGFTGRPIVGRVEYHPLFPNEYVSRLERVGRPASATAIFGDGQFAIPVFPGPGVLAFKADGIDDSQYAPAFVSADELKELFHGTTYRDYEERVLNVAAGGQARSVISQAEYRALVLINPGPGQQSISKDVAFQRAAKVRGAVLGPDGQPLAGATVIGLPPSMFSSRALKTAEFEVPGLNLKQPHSLLFTHDEHKLGAELTVRGSESEPVTVRLQPLGSAFGRLLNEDGEPMANTTLDFCRARMYGPGIRTAKTDAEGRFQVEGLATGQKYEVILWGGPTVNVIYRDLSITPRETKDLGDIRARNVRVFKAKKS